VATNNELVATEPSFVLDSIDLKQLQSNLKRVSKAAVDVLIKCLESEDEKMRMQAAKMLLEFQITVAKEISADQMSRLIAEVKLSRNPQGRIAEGDKPQAPLVDFDNIREVD
jgi:hypothetical protein